MILIIEKATKLVVAQFSDVDIENININPQYINMTLYLFHTMGDVDVPGDLLNIDVDYQYDYATATIGKI